MKEISFLIFVGFVVLFLLSTLQHIDAFRTKNSLFSVILSLEKQGKPGAKKIKYLFFAMMLSLAAFFICSTFEE